MVHTAGLSPSFFLPLALPSLTWRDLGKAELEPGHSDEEKGGITLTCIRVERTRHHGDHREQEAPVTSPTLPSVTLG